MLNGISLFFIFFYFIYLQYDQAYLNRMKVVLKKDLDALVFRQFELNQVSPKEVSAKRHWFIIFLLLLQSPYWGCV